MTNDELIEIVQQVMDEVNGHRDKAVMRLSAMVEDDEDLMLAFAEQGHEIIKAIFESFGETKH